MRQLKKIVISIITYVLLLNIFSTYFMLGLYTVQKDIFVELMCENKNRPELDCDGKCSLSKLIQQENEKNTKSTVLNLMQFEWLGFSDFDFEFETECTFLTHEPNFSFSNLYSFIFYNDWLQPPSIS